MEKLNKWGLSHNILLAYLSLLFGVGFGIAGMAIYPPGVINGSVLILIGQLFVLSAGFIGLDIKFDLSNKYFHARQTPLESKKDKEEIEKIINDQYGQLSENQEVEYNDNN